MTLTVGTRVRLKDAYLDEAQTRPVTGAVESISPRPAYVVMFDHDDPRLPPGGEFGADQLVALSN